VSGEVVGWIVFGVIVAFVAFLAFVDAHDNWW
jgi:hypothetical protein